jgi:hypothetical protein
MINANQSWQWAKIYVWIIICPTILLEEKCMYLKLTHTSLKVFGDKVINVPGKSTLVLKNY